MRIAPLRAIAGILGLGLLITALVMLLDPRMWYDTLPGVSASGPFNAHFARDIGCANLVAGAVLLARAVGQRPPVSALVAVAAFLWLHAFVHLGELFETGEDAGHRIVRDFSTVYLPALLTTWFAVDAVARAGTRSAAAPGTLARQRSR